MTAIIKLITTTIGIAFVALAIYTSYLVGSDQRLNAAMIEAAQAAEVVALESLRQAQEQQTQIRAAAEALLAAVE